MATPTEETEKVASKNLRLITLSSLNSSHKSGAAHLSSRASLGQAIGPCSDSGPSILYNMPPLLWCFGSLLGTDHVPSSIQHHRVCWFPGQSNTVTDPNSY